MGSCYSKSERRDCVESVDVESGGERGGYGTGTPPRSHRRKKRKPGKEIEIPGRMCFNSASKVSCLHTQQGKKGTNQDAMLVWESFSGRSDTIFCGVFDGHGPFGHMVAKKIRDSLPLILSTQWEARSSSSNGENHQNQIEDEDEDDHEEGHHDDNNECSDQNQPQQLPLPDMYLPLKHAFLKAFKLMDKELKLHPTIDCFCSGSTAVTLVKQGEHLVIGNVGDSRAVMATRDQDGTLIAVQLTVDLKPDLPGEAARIQQCKGRVFAMQDEPEVARVWLPNNDSPGLAMARAFGDFCLKDFGLISVPDVYYRHLTEKDEFIILATDGVWDVLSNKEAVEIVASAPSRATAARALVDCAVRAWRLKYPTSKNDDCAVVCLFLEHKYSISVAVIETDKTKNHEGAKEIADEGLEVIDYSHGIVINPDPPLETIGSSSEIVPVTEENFPAKSQSRRSLAEFISSADEDEEWSALEGVTRVNSLLSLPRFLSGDKRSANRRKWL
ncbi:probable protein phosphatase 2C 18 [Humulus lupulus]|uniref:probable protein phosphatase 2C 18 n=1 Tax=Humulus lupulus TaxID=3486 RepID=UPI002B401D40|nr:probable protein phosphatase 2C 18 [Humulus lupulus]